LIKNQLEYIILKFQRILGIHIYNINTFGKIQQ